MQILTNLALLGVATFMFGLQRLFYGTLRPIEIEQLYEKAWFAITETCLAMTIFREEVGGWFLVMFVCLLIGKVWGWIGEGRVDILEQQPPANPRLFHIRISFSLLISILFDMYMLNYSIQVVLQQARPNMMVMFAFEFAVLMVTSSSTAFRYLISVYEGRVVRKQTNLRLEERKAEQRRRQEAAQRRDAASDSTSAVEPSATNEHDESDVDTNDIDVPGWEDKGRWVFFLDLATGMVSPDNFCGILADSHHEDFFKLVLYLTFFFVLCMFYGMPIHIVRDVVLTIRSFYKRIHDFARYRHATKDMNERYPDATSEEIAREDVCIICREAMRPWRQSDAQGAQQPGETGANGAAGSSVDQRYRPKKLPCGHILHFACLRSWLERQQSCPTCRRDVIAPTSSNTANIPRGPGQLANQLARMQANQARGHPPAAGEPQQPAHGQARIRMFNLGPFRIGFGAIQGLQGGQQQFNLVQQPPQQQAAGVAGLPPTGNAFGIGGQAPAGNQQTAATFSATNVSAQLHQVELQLMREVNNLRLQNDQLHLVRALQGELARLRITQAQASNPVNNTELAQPQHRPFTLPMTMPNTIPPVQVFGLSSQQQGMDSNHQRLPPGVTIPEGWTMLPLQRISNVSVPNPSPWNATSISDPMPQMRSTESAGLSTERSAASSGSSRMVSQLPTLGGELTSSENSEMHHVSINGTEDAVAPSMQVSSEQPSAVREGLETANGVHERAAPIKSQMGIAHASAQAPTISLPIPAWGTNPEAEANRDEISNGLASRNETVSKGDVGPSGSRSEWDEGTGKGKARAVTVQDDTEDID